jgi:hypothetical protein
LLKVLVAAFLLRFVAGELAAYAGRHWRSPGPAPIDRPPGLETDRD